MYSFTEENYLKAIYKLQEKSEDPISTNAVAEMLQTKAASVTDMMRKLADKKLLKYEKYKGVLLSDKGRRVALDIVRKHRLWEVFLHEKLKFGWDEVHDVAEQLEHINSELLIDKLDDFLGYPTHDPHGDPIPKKGGVLVKTDMIPLYTVSEGSSCVMSGVVDHSPVFLKHLDKTGFGLGKEIAVLEVNEYDGSLRVKISQGGTMDVSKDVARNILVKIK